MKRTCDARRKRRFHEIELRVHAVRREQMLAQFARGDESGKGDHHGADSRCREHRDDELGAVRIEEPHVGPLAATEGDKSAGELGRPAIGFGVADSVGIADKKRVVTARLRLAPQDSGDRQLTGSYPAASAAAVCCLAISAWTAVMSSARTF